MKIIHVINSMSTSHGGPTRTALLTMQGMRSLGMDVEIVTNQTAPGEEAVSDDPSIRYLPRLGFHDKRWGYSKAIPQELAKIKNVDIYHIQGIWLYSGYTTARYARKQGCPYLVTLHGTLYPEALAQSFPDKKDGFEFISAPAVATSCLYPCYLREEDGTLPCIRVYQSGSRITLSDGVRRSGGAVVFERYKTHRLPGARASP